MISPQIWHYVVAELSHSSNVDFSVVKNCFTPQSLIVEINFRLLYLVLLKYAYGYFSKFSVVFLLETCDKI